MIFFYYCALQSKHNTILPRAYYYCAFLGPGKHRFFALCGRGPNLFPTGWSNRPTTSLTCKPSLSQSPSLPRSPTPRRTGRPGGEGQTQIQWLLVVVGWLVGWLVGGGVHTSSAMFTLGDSSVRRTYLSCLLHVNEQSGAALGNSTSHRDTLFYDKFSFQKLKKS